MTARWLPGVLVLAALAACTGDAPTAVEVRALLPTDRGITQLRITGAIDGAEAFAPGILPEEPRALAAEETAVILLPDTAAGRELTLQVEAMSGDSVVESASATAMIARAELRTIDIAITGADDVVDSVAPMFSTFAFRAADNPSLGADTAAAILGTQITAALPKGADLRAMVATFTHTGETVMVRDTVQASGQTANDFTSAVHYTVSGGERSRTYMAKATVIDSEQPTLLAFGFAARDNPGLASDVVGTVMGMDVKLTVPSGVDRSSLVPVFAAYGAVTIDGVSASSGETAHDFTSKREVVITTHRGSRRFNVIAN